MANELTLKAYAKINKSLKVEGERPDGYHKIRSEFQTVSLYDELTFTPTASCPLPTSSCAKSQDPPPICHSGLDPESLTNLPYGKNDLIYKSVTTFQKKYNQKNLSLSINVNKHIPAAAGLGGGSSDAALTLLALAHLTLPPENRPSLKDLAKLGEEIGADVPFLVYANAKLNPELGYSDDPLATGRAICEGIGEIVTPLPPEPKVNIILIKPPVDVSTPEVYAMYDKNPELSKEAQNDLQPHAEAAHPIIKKIIEAAKKDYPKAKVYMTGSGPTVVVEHRHSEQSDRHCEQSDRHSEQSDRHCEERSDEAIRRKRLASDPYKDCEIIFCTNTPFTI